MRDSVISGLLYARLERNAERYAEIQAENFGLGIPHDLWSEYYQLPRKQAKLRAQLVDALRDEGQSADDISHLIADDPAASAPAGLRIENRGDAVTVWMYGEIGVDFTADDLKKELQRYPDRAIRLHVNSEGGSVTDGVAIHSLIKSHSAPVDVVVDALAASAASFSIMAADSISMALGSYMMVHYVSASLSNATEADFAAATKRMRETNNTLKKFYLPRWKGTETQLEAALLQEKYFSAEECVTAGLADRVIEVERCAACVGSNFPRESAPAELMIAARGGPSQFLNQPSRQMTLHRIITTEK